MTAHELLLQPDSPAIEVLERELEGARRLDAASAFVTRSGIELLLPLPRPALLRLVCCAGHGPTDPDSIAMAADELGPDVRLVTGSDAARFHPKLYLVANRDRLVVLAGSGNLTAGGLSDNVEQFECLVLPASSPVALAQERRFNLLWDQGAPLEEIRSTRFWKCGASNGFAVRPSAWRPTNSTWTWTATLPPRLLLPHPLPPGLAGRRRMLSP